MHEYAAFLERKMQQHTGSGFAPLWLPERLFPFQQRLTTWALEHGRFALFEDCGMGKTAQQLVWAENVVRHTNKRVLILTPLAVGQQTVQEGVKFEIPCQRVKDGAEVRQHTSGIFVTNYEKLHLFTAADFIGCVADESSCIKHFGGATQKALTRFMQAMPYRLLCTATPSPNDYIELGTSSEILGMLGYTDMLSRFFVMDDKKRYRINDVKLAKDAKTGNHYARLAYRVSQQIGAWRFKGHAEEPFWRWVCSWARACRTPDDTGYPDDRFVLPPLIEKEHVITPTTAPEGMLFTLPAFGLREEREERRRTLEERCAYVASLVNHDRPAIVWCHMNPEGELLATLIPDSVEIAGRHDDDTKEDRWQAFLTGKVRVLISKPKIGAWGLNLQHCNHIVTFASHSWEQRYQSIRRCWRFGQTQPVTVDTVATKGEQGIMENLQRKARMAERMFAALVAQMYAPLHLTATTTTLNTEIPTWLRP